MDDHGFQFESTKTAAKKNHNLLQKFDFNLKSLIASHRNSIIFPGAEFGSIQALKTILH